MLNLTDLLRIPQVDTGLRFDISPDGQHVAFAWNQTGRWEIYDILSKQSVTGKRRTISRHGWREILASIFTGRQTDLAYALDLDGSESYHIVLQDLKTGSNTDTTPSFAYAQQPNFAFSPMETHWRSFPMKEASLLYIFSPSRQAKKRCSWTSIVPSGMYAGRRMENGSPSKPRCRPATGAFFWSKLGQGHTKQIELNGMGLNAQHPAWSPDSELLAFSAQSGEWFDIGLYDMQTGEIRWLTHNSGDDTSPRWSSGWKTNLLAACRRRGQLACMFMKTACPSSRFHVEMGIHHLPQFTPDGEILFLFESPKQPPDLWKRKLDGTFEQLTNSMPG